MTILIGSLLAQQNIIRQFKEDTIARDLFSLNDPSHHLTPLFVSIATLNQDQFQCFIEQWMGNIETLLSIMFQHKRVTVEILNCFEIQGEVKPDWYRLFDLPRLEPLTPPPQLWRSIGNTLLEAITVTPPQAEPSYQ